MADPYAWLERPGALVDQWVRERHGELRLDAADAQVRLVARSLATAPPPPVPPHAVEAAEDGVRCYRVATGGATLERLPLDAALQGHGGWAPVLSTADLGEHADARITGVVAGPAGSDRVLVSVLRAGADAVRWVEADVRAGGPVVGGFDIGPARCSVAWSDHDTVVVSRPVRTSSTSSSWIAEARRRGTAGTVRWFTAEAGHPAGAVLRDPTAPRRFLAVDYVDYQERRYSVGTPGPAGPPRWRPVPVPGSVRVLLLGPSIVLLPTRDTRIGGRHVRAGSVLRDDLEAVLEGRLAPEVVAEPSPGSRVTGADVTRSHLVLTETTPGGSRVRVVDGSAPGRVLADLGGRPTVTVRALAPACDATAELFAVERSGPVEPDRLEYYDARRGRVGEPAVRGRAFAHERYEVRVLDLRGAGGRRVPATMVAPRDLPTDGRNPLMLSAYGAFGAVERLGYLSGIGPGWLDGADGARDGVYVLAHLGVPPATRPAPADRLVRLVEDLCAVAEDLCERGVTAPARLGLYGTSHGGLVTAATMARRPDLVGAAACGVAVLDLASYVRLGGGAWAAEYGDPDDSSTWERLRTVSPLHLVRPGVRYPPTLLWTSSNDDRVAPAHARRMAARMREVGAPVRYREEATGGHDPSGTAVAALSYGFLRHHLGHPAPSAAPDAATR